MRTKQTERISLRIENTAYKVISNFAKEKFEGNMSEAIRHIAMEYNKVGTFNVCECGKQMTVSRIGVMTLFKKTETIYSGDFWRCPSCYSKVLTNFGDQISHKDDILWEHYLKEVEFEVD